MKVTSTARRAIYKNGENNEYQGKTRMLRECTPEGILAWSCEVTVFEFKHKILDHLCVAEHVGSNRLL